MLFLETLLDQWMKAADWAFHLTADQFWFILPIIILISLIALGIAAHREITITGEFDTAPAYALVTAFAGFLLILLPAVLVIVSPLAFPVWLGVRLSIFMFNKPAKNLLPRARVLEKR